MPFASINSTNPRTNPWNFHEKILRIGGAGKWDFFEAAILNFLSRPFWIFFASYQWKTQPIYMRYHFFQHYGWFFQNLGKELWRTFMHTTVTLSQPEGTHYPHPLLLAPQIFRPCDGPALSFSFECKLWISPLNCPSPLRSL